MTTQYVFFKIENKRLISLGDIHMFFNDLRRQEDKHNHRYLFQFLCKKGIVDLRYLILNKETLPPVYPVYVDGTRKHNKLLEINSILDFCEVKKPFKAYLAM